MDEGEKTISSLADRILEHDARSKFAEITAEQTTEFV